MADGSGLACTGLVNRGTINQVDSIRYRPDTGAPRLAGTLMPQSTLRHDWTRDEVRSLFALPFNDLLERAHQTHRQHHDPNAVQISTLLSIKTGGCPEDCSYCPQAARYDTGVQAQKLMSVEAVLERARAARDAGASRFCMGAAWRGPKDRDVTKVAQIVAAVKSLGLETCATLGLLSGAQARTLKDAGLDYYNHNLDTAPEFYGEIIHTRGYQDRLDTLDQIRAAGLKTCCGGIVGMGETRDQRAGLLQALANLPEHPQSVPINQLVAVPGTPLGEADPLDPFEFVRTIAVARLLMPASMVRLSAGRQQMDDAVQALCFFAGANSIFYGEKLLTTGNPDVAQDRALFRRLDLRALDVTASADTAHASVLDARSGDGDDDEATGGGCGSGCGGRTAVA
jgi:biotin synthase